MKKILLIATAFASFGVFAQNGQRIIVKLKPGIDVTAYTSLHNTTGIAAIDKINNDNHFTAIHKLRTGKRNPSNAFVFTFPDGINKEAIMKAYRNTNLVAYTEVDAIGSADGIKGFTTTPDDLFYSRQWSLKNDGTFNMYTAVSGADMQMEDAWDIEQGSSSIVVATMDSGLKLDHPEFEGRLWINTLEIPGNGIDDDNNGYVDDINGWDFVNGDNNPTDDLGHGTNVTGIIGANGNNGIGYTGIDRNCKLMTLKGLGSNNFGYYTWWAEAITYATDNGANLINLSVGASSPSDFLQEAVNYAVENNVVVTVSMGNDNDDIASYLAINPGVIAVGSTNPDDKRTAPFFWDLNSGSDYGEHIAVVAPGNFIYGLSHVSDTDYDTYWGGTSQAAPAVLGIASLLLAQDPTRTPAQIKAILESTAEDQVGDPTEDTPGFDIYYGYGRVNAFNALQYTLSTEEHKTTAILSVYPNPSEGTVNINLKQYPAQVSVYNMLGQLIVEKNIDTNENTIYIREKGVFLVSVKNIEGSDTRKVIIK